MKEKLKIIKDYCRFTEDTVYVLLLIPRKKDNKNRAIKNNKDRKNSIRYLISSVEDAGMALQDFEEYIERHSDTVYRVYLTVNPRSLLKASRELQIRMANWQFELIEGKTEPYKKISRLSSEWKSILCSPKCRADKLFMFDIDFSNSEEEDIKKVIAFREEIAKLTEIKYFGETKNGFCLVCKPFNPKLVKLPELIELKNDSYIHLN